ncbi:MAG: general secretion pathway protein D [Lentimonas sp.]|jgi:general secretion pathway protein D
MKLHPYTLFLLLLLVQLWISPSVAQGQQSVPPAPITPLEPEVENPDEIIGLIVLSDESPLQVLDMLERLTDKIILRRQDIAAAKINFNSRGSLTKSEAVLALESLLSLNGIMLTEMGGRFMKAVPATNVNSHVPEMIIDSTLDLAPSQQIYAKLFKLDYLQAETISGTIVTPLLSQNSSVVIFQKSNAILITDALINLQRIERLIEEMDKPQEIREEIQFVKLNFVQAAEMQQRIENLIQGPLKIYLEGNTSVTADERTNQLILITHPGNLEVIMNIVESVDVDAAPLTSSEVFPLRQAKAEEVVPIIEEIISGQKEGREQDAQVGNNNDTTPQTATPNFAPGVPPIPTAAPTPTTIAANLSSGLASSSLQFSNFVGLSADERTNSIVAYGTHQDLKTLKDLIEKIDIPLPQVRIEAIITEVTLNENQTSGISALGFEVGADGDLNFGGTVQTGVGDNNTAINSLGGVIGTGFNLTGLTNPSNADTALSALLSAADSDSKVQVLSAPSIVVSHNEEGVINISQSRPIITSSTAFTNSDNNVRSNVEFRDIGIQLTVTPLIGADGSVQMKIEQTVDNIAGEVTIDNNEQPIIGRREANSTITVTNREIIILGGLQENRKNESYSYFPILGKLPLINKFFGGDSTEYTKTELVIFIRPTIIKTPNEANEISEQQINAIEGGDAVKKYLETGTTGNTYIEDSKFGKEEKRKQKKEAKKEVTAIGEITKTATETDQSTKEAESKSTD